MRVISQYFTDAINQSTQEWRVKIFFHSTDKNSPVVATLTDSEIVQSTLKIESQSTQNSNFTLGGVSSSLCSFNINTEGISVLKTANILRKFVCFEVCLWLKTNDPNQKPTDPTLNNDNTENTTSKIRLGYFYIDNIQDNTFDTSLTGYDAMLAADKAISNVDLSFLYQTGATISTYMTRIASAMTHDNYAVTADLTKQPYNNTYTLYYANDQTPTTYRDVLGQLSILAGGFFTINADGDLVFKEYSTLEAVSFTADRVFEYSQGNQTFQVALLSCNVAAFDVSATSATPLTADYSEVNLSENSFLRAEFPVNASTIPASVQSIITNLFNVVSNLRFTSGTVKIPSRPDLELGDNITCICYGYDRTTQTVTNITYTGILVAKHVWQYQTYSNITSLGYAKAEANQTQSTSTYKTSTDATPLNSIIRTIGTQEVNIAQAGQQQLFSLYFILIKDMEASMSISFTANVSNAGTYRLRILLDNVLYITEPKMYVPSAGYHTFSVTLGIGSYEYDGQHSLKVILISDDTFSCNIQPNDYQILITASAVREAVPEWTGVYEVDDTVNHFDLLDSLSFSPITDTAPTVTFTP